VRERERRWVVGMMGEWAGKGLLLLKVVVVVIVVVVVVVVVDSQEHVAYPQ